MMTNKKKIIFVCVENSCRSQIAEAFAKIHGKDKIEALSAGSNASGIVNPKAIESMKEVDYDLSIHQSQSLKDFEGEEFDLAVTMGCGDECPYVVTKKREDWDIPDPKNRPADEFGKIRDLIEARVKKLLAQL